LCKETTVERERESTVTKFQMEEIRAGAIRLRNEEEQVNKRQERQANRTNNKPLPSQPSLADCFQTPLPLVVETRLPDSNL
jgi:hypothetical protein